MGEQQRSTTHLGSGSLVGGEGKSSGESWTWKTVWRSSPAAIAASAAPLPSHYAASKAALIGLAHAYAARLAPEGITANVIAPALVETEMIRSNARASPDRIPVGRFGRPEEIADIAVTLVSNAYVTGQTVQVNGGAYFT